MFDISTRAFSSQAQRGTAEDGPRERTAAALVQKLRKWRLDADIVDVRKGQRPSVPVLTGILRKGIKKRRNNVCIFTNTKPR